LAFLESKKVSPATAKSVQIHAEFILTCMDARDAHGLATLYKTGSDVSKPHWFDFYLYFPDRKDAGEIAEILKNKGYHASVRLGADNASWLCLARKAIVPSHQVLASIRDELEILVKPRRGEYDGWEAAVPQFTGGTEQA
jgi:hypothetical protein